MKTWASMLLALVLAVTGATMVGAGALRLLGSRTTAPGTVSETPPGRTFSPDETERSLDYWSPERLQETDADAGDPGFWAGRPLDERPPEPVTPTAVQRPYESRPEAIIGRLFFVDDKGRRGSCSATVVDSPTRNMVWTAGHCVHGGRGGTWFRDMVFIPAYNSGGDLRDQRAFAPYGKWAVEFAGTSNMWIKYGAHKENSAYSWDYGAFTVAPNRAGQRLQDVLGAGARIYFNPPRDLLVSSFGYPAGAPYRGDTLYRCDSRVSNYRPRGSVAGQDLNGPPMFWIGCGMTSGSSGGGWFANIGGQVYLVSNTSMGWHDAGVQAGPYLDQGAREVFEKLVRTSEHVRSPA
ncbi:putative secreted protein [Carbonactinospora thermoautotrophica]|uniref:Putative secreted protein n=1 Tax=Carbonactinospora thermoautotrophica TaxID=1469144 RepID=A0A132MQ29_9ACTN|nr:hypothetical protein [Carbonactinospora thermoautotrophica]KWW99893.1 putative secreted protein [Carbonactinospora thermoautotrophica]